MNSIRFLYPQALYLLLFIPLLLFLQWRYVQQLTRGRRALRVGPQLSRVSRLGSLRRPWVGMVFATLVICGLVLSLSRPQLLREENSEIIRRLDIVFLLDISPSMNAEDLLPSRLDRARQFIGEIIIGESLIERVGLVTFSGSSIILSYLTSDVGNVLFYLDYLAEQPLTSLGTNIGSAIASGVQVMERGNRGQEKGNREVLVLISDGEDHGEELAEAIREAVGRKLRIYSVGIGSETGGFVPVTREDGSRDYLKDQHGVRILSRFNERTLRRIAEVTGGRFYRAFQGVEIGKSLREIVAREREVVGYRKQQDWMEVYDTLLMGSAFLFLAAWGIQKE